MIANPELLVALSKYPGPYSRSAITGNVIVCGAALPGAGVFTPEIFVDHEAVLGNW